MRRRTICFDASIARVAASTRLDINAWASVLCCPKGNARCDTGAIVVVVTPAEICAACCAMRATDDVSATPTDTTGTVWPAPAATAVAPSTVPLSAPACAAWGWSGGRTPSSCSMVLMGQCRTTSPTRYTKSRPLSVCSVTSFAPMRYTPCETLSTLARFSLGTPSSASFRRRSTRLSTSPTGFTGANASSMGALASGAAVTATAAIEFDTAAAAAADKTIGALKPETPTALVPAAAPGTAGCTRTRGPGNPSGAAGGTPAGDCTAGTTPPPTSISGSETILGAGSPPGGGGCGGNAFASTPALGSCTGESCNLARVDKGSTSNKPPKSLNRPAIVSRMSVCLGQKKPALFAISQVTSKSEMRVGPSRGTHPDSGSPGALSGKSACILSRSCSRRATSERITACKRVVTSALYFFNREDNHISITGPWPST
mmetsp:Transcript_9917/g.26196  ORF Transcript_9917/g.26196 Transcript_9917/m.26196 type:complete len:431 (+) Transcript_9917:1015-2307(+)